MPIPPYSRIQCTTLSGQSSPTWKHASHSRKASTDPTHGVPLPPTSRRQPSHGASGPATHTRELRRRRASGGRRRVGRHRSWGAVGSRFGRRSRGRFNASVATAVAADSVCDGARGRRVKCARARAAGRDRWRGRHKVWLCGSAATRSCARRAVRLTCPYSGAASVRAGGGVWNEGVGGRGLQLVDVLIRMQRCGILVGGEPAVTFADHGESCD